MICFTQNVGITRYEKVEASFVSVVLFAARAVTVKFTPLLIDVTESEPIALLALTPVLVKKN